MKIVSMTPEQAVEIAGWQYEEPYSIYNMEGSEACIRELLDGSYYSVLGREGELSGYFCYGISAQVPAGNDFQVYEQKDLMDIGLGMKPELCGRGNGAAFVLEGIEFGKKTFGVSGFRLTVAAVNARAVAAYGKAGFIKAAFFFRKSSQPEMKFWVMTREE